jgi:hypothetical protein
VLQFSDPDRPWQGAVVMTAAALAVTTPRYQWYALLLVMLVALDGRPEWLAFAAGAYYAAEPNLGRYTIPNRFHDAVAYGVPVVVVAVGSAVRYELARRRGAGLEPAAVPAGSAIAAGSAVVVPAGAAAALPAGAAGLAGPRVADAMVVAASSAFAAPVTVTAPVALAAPGSVEADTEAGRLVTADEIRV